MNLEQRLIELIWRNGGKPIYLTPEEFEEAGEIELEPGLQDI